MHVLLDTSVIVAGCVRAHPYFARAFPILQRICSGEDRGSLSTHTLAEAHAALTSLALSPAIHPAEAQRMLQENILDHCRLVSLSAEDYREVINRVSATGVSGAAIYDMLLLRCADKFPCDRIYSFNVDTLRRLSPQLGDRLAAP